jgi:hypothetical protein
MSVRTEPAVGAVHVPDTVDELVTDPGWQARCDQLWAVLHCTTLPAHPGTVFGGAR